MARPYQALIDAASTLTDIDATNDIEVNYGENASAATFLERNHQPLSAARQALGQKHSVPVRNEWSWISDRMNDLSHLRTCLKIDF